MNTAARPLESAPTRADLFHLLASRCAPQSPALVSRESGAWRALDHAGLQNSAARAQTRLELAGVRPGDRVALLGPGGPDWVVALLGILRAGAVALPLDPRSTTLELERAARLTRPGLVLIGGLEADSISPTGVTRLPLDDLRLGEIPAAAQRRPSAPGDVAILSCTSGSTGLPKAVQTTHGNLEFQVAALGEGMRLSEDEVFLEVLGPNHLLQLVGGLLAPLARGASIVHAPSLLPAELGAALRDNRVTRMVAVPLLLDGLRRRVEQGLARRARMAGLALRLAGALPATLRRRLFRGVLNELGGDLRGFVVGGAQLHPATERFWTRLGVDVLVGYGLTETSPVITMNRPGAVRAGTVGRPLRGVEIRVQSSYCGGVGEVQTRGPHTCAGYLGRPDLDHELFTRDGWLRTGDLGRLDRRGFLHLSGRERNLVALPSGKKIQLEEVELALEGSRTFDEACALGVQSPHGEQLICVVAGVSEPDLDTATVEVQRRVRVLAPHKRPSRVFVHPGALPRTATRKLRRADIAAWVRNQEKQR